MGFIIPVLTALLAGFPVLTTAHLHVQRAWSKESDQLSGDTSEGMDEDEPRVSVVLNVTTPIPISPQKAPSDSNFKDFIRCLPIHLSKRILRMLDHKSLHRCSFVSLHWNFLVKQMNKDVTTNRSLRSEIALLQVLWDASLLTLTDGETQA